MRIKPEEIEIVGGWVLRDGRMHKDEVSNRIEMILASELQKLATSQDGWERLYRDPNDERLWELTYPQSEMQGGGPRALIVNSPEAAAQKYHLD
jgi:hypothetical protein